MEDCDCEEDLGLNAVNGETNQIVRLLDAFEKRVESLREQALAVERERSVLLESLQKLQDSECIKSYSEGEKEEIEANAERLICQCLTVEVIVTTPRNDHQEVALQKISKIMMELDNKFKDDTENGKTIARSYLNACLAEPIGTNIDQRFQGLILDCTADDQKAIRRRLESMISENAEGVIAFQY